jgi:hypothetical protein
VGHDPVRDASGDTLSVLHYLPGAVDPVKKMLAEAGATRELFPPPEAIGEDEVAGGTLLLCEGEPDCVRLWSAGVAAVAVPGAQNWQSEWAPRFRGRRWTVIVCFDADETGRAKAPGVAADLLAAGVDARLADLDQYAEGVEDFDLTDLLGERDPASARELLATLAEDAVVPDAAEADESQALDETFRLVPVDWQVIEAQDGDDRVRPT